jgi:LPS-assembly protein
MQRRLILCVLPYIYSSISYANDAAWNCEQSKDSKQWVCSGDNKPAAPAPAESEPAKAPVSRSQPKAVAPVIEEATPAIVEPIAPEPETNLAKPQTAVEPAPVPVPARQAPPPALVNPEATATAPEKDEAEPEAAEKAQSEAPNPIPAPVKQTATAPSSDKRAGWTCGSSDKTEGWDCNLTGKDPKGVAKPVMAAPSSSFSLLTPTFNYNQEQTFNTLTSQLPYDPWQNCDVPGIPKPTFVPRKQLRDKTPLDVKSNYSEVFDNEVSSYFGNVEMNRADQHSISNIANYDSVSGTLGLQGSVYYSEDELAMYGESAQLKLDQDQAKIRDVLFISPGMPLRGQASAVYRENKILSRYKDVSYTSCKPGNQDWMVHASELKMNKETGKGAAKNTWVEFKGVPVFYSPYLSFPIDDRRQTGFLAPSFGNTQRNGYELTVPFYWNIAPNYDATFKARYMDKRGILLGGQARYLTESSKGKLGVEYLPVDNKPDNTNYKKDGLNPWHNQSRYLLTFTNSSKISPHITSNIDANYRSDVDYFNDLGSSLSRPFNSFLRSTADVSYANKDVSLVTRAESYQSVDRSLTGFALPYRRLPQVNFNYNHSFDFMPLNTGLESEYVYFQHNDRINGQRYNVKPSISFPLKTSSAYITPKFSLQHTEYLLGHKGNNNDFYLDRATNTYKTIGFDTVSRTLPIFSADAGVFLERDLTIGNQSYVHSLEPRLFYLYIPKTNQDQIPIFDTALNDFNFDSMFRENRFSGTDRTQDANQITTALTSRLIDNKGRETVKFNLGQIFYFQNRDVTLPQLYPDYQNTSADFFQKYGHYAATRRYIPETNSFSSIVGELSTRLTDHISVNTGLQYTPQRGEITRGQADFHYVNNPGEIVNLGYRYRKNIYLTDKENIDLGRPLDIIQTDASFHWPVYDNWSVVGRWQYSWLYNSTQDTFFGFEKENCCWRFRIIGRRWVNNINILNALNGTGPFNPALANNTNAAQADSQTGVFVQIELKGLTGIGDKLDNFFEQQIYGYQRPSKDD